jgi:hypothetical protein
MVAGAEQVPTIDQLHQQVMEHQAAELQVGLFLRAVAQAVLLAITV